MDSHKVIRILKNTIDKIKEEMSLTVNVQKRAILMAKIEMLVMVIELLQKEEGENIQ